jgi:hypothetical protein
MNEEQLLEWELAGETAVTHSLTRRIIIGANKLAELLLLVDHSGRAVLNCLPRSNTEIVGSNPTQGRDVCAFILWR